ncbi:hypothetical protein FZEAL_6396 [Fusarium zealandicum]|uniref:Uncharacterized protein n=1 Tax=Fusarium zealandicum TaxID=1053134 RepID=A0A8H4UI68_9HYPO|nr:hypothetical protein FZEAL_6396 [Fusarium zealandicum]
MHPAYTLYIGLRSRVSELKNNMYNAVNKTISAQTAVRQQVAGKTKTDAEREAEEGRRMRERDAKEQQSSDNMFAFYGARPPPGQFIESS